MADPLLETIAKALRDDDAYHDDRCESEFLQGPMTNSPCGCAERGAVLVKAALLSDAGSTQWGVRWPDEVEFPLLREDAETAVVDAAHVAADPAQDEDVRDAYRGAVVVRRQVLELHGDWEDAT